MPALALWRVHAPDPIPPLKGEVARAVVAALDGWSQGYAAELLSTDQPRISDLRNDRLQRFSLEQLIRFASRIGGDANVTVTWTGRRRILRLAPTRRVLVLRD